MPFASPGADSITGHVGGVTFQYDPSILVPADVEIGIPPDGKTRTFAVKLVPVSAPGSADALPAPEEPGLTLALLERPYADYAGALEAGDFPNDVEPTSLDGANGIFVRAGNIDGRDVDYTLVPVGTRALLVTREADGESAAVGAALAAAVRSIDLPG